MLPVGLLIGLMILTWVAAIVATYMESPEETDAATGEQEAEKHRAA